MLSVSFSNRVNIQKGGSILKVDASGLTRRAFSSTLGTLIPKNHFASFGLFREPPLINWTFTKSILFTAYDIYRSNDFWIDSTIKAGKTLKEAMVELGMPQSVTFVADTGIFEIEAKKVGVAKRLGIEPIIELPNDQIFSAYELSGADFFVSPDEIITATDSKETVLTKTRAIKENLLELLEIIPTKKIIAVIQIADADAAIDLFDYYRENGISIFAAGGMLPLYFFDKDQFKNSLEAVRKLTEDYHLHAFGLPNIKLIPYYLRTVRMDSIDTSALLYLTARRRYLDGLNTLQVRYVDFEKCDCKGCRNLSPDMYTMSVDFFVNLYTHNVLEASKISVDCQNPDWVPEERQEKPIEPVREQPVETQRRKSIPEQNKSNPSEWTTADKLL